MVANMNNSCELEDMKISIDFVLRIYLFSVRMPLNRDCVNDRIQLQMYKSLTFFSRPVYALYILISSSNCTIYIHIYCILTYNLNKSSCTDRFISAACPSGRLKIT